MRSGLLIFFSLLLLSGCRTATHTHQPPPEPVVPAPQMIFLSFHIHRDSSRSDIKLIEKKTVDGRIKGKPQQTESANRLVISIAGKNQVLYSEAIPHPLFRDAETTNSKGEFERKSVTLAEAEFFVRMRLPEGSDHVLVEEFIGNTRVNSAEYSL